jgi:hypothetical protein
MKIFQSAFGWKAESFFPLDDTTRITITTMKRYGGLLTTTVTGSRKEGEMYYWTVCKDYSRTWGVSKSIRATQKTVAEQQQTVLAQLDQIKSEVVAFYEQLRETT